MPTEFSVTREESNRRQTNRERGRDPVECVGRLGSESLAVPYKFAPPQAGYQLRPELLQPMKRKNWMWQPITNGLADTPEELNFGASGSEIAKCMIIPPKPKSHRHGRGNCQRNQCYQGGA